VGEYNRPEKPEWSKFEYGDPVDIIQRRTDSVKFPGHVIGWYKRLDGPQGYILQHERDRIVHVYPEVSVYPRNGQKQEQ